MRVNCPHCHVVLNVVDAEQSLDVSCPSCGSRFPLGELTVSHRQETMERIGHFDLLENVGAGQFGSVWKGYDRKLDRVVAIKIPRYDELSEGQRRLIFREAQAAAKLEHPNVVRVFEVHEEQNQVYIVTQFINGTTLRELIKNGQMTTESSVRMMTLIADAVHHAHEAGVIHRDLKPSNILVDVEGEPFVSDFGLAKINSAEMTVTVTGVILGTPAYMSPEQARGESHSADCRSDVYSLGVVLYELLTGQRPFEGSTTLLLHQIQSSDPRSLRAIKPAIPRDLETICLKALEKKPERRYATALEFADELRRFLAGESIVARPASRLEKSWRWMTRHRALSSAVLIAIATSTLAAAAMLKPSGPVVPPGAAVTITKPLTVHLKTNPAGAKLVLHAIDPSTGLPDPSKSIRPSERTPLSLKVLPGDYLVVAVLDDGRFHEVYRHVPKLPDAIPSVYPHRIWTKRKDNSLSLLTIEIPPASVTDGMAFLEGTNEFRVGDPQSTVIPHHVRSISSFFMDTHEVTSEDYKQVNGGRLPFTRIGKDWEYPDDFPITGLLFDEALMYAELAGKRLPTEFEYEFAATRQGVAPFPWGNAPPTEDAWTLRPAVEVTQDATSTEPPILGLFSNAAEFTDSLFRPYPSSPIAGMESPDINALGTITLRGGSIASKPDQDLFVSGVRHRTGMGAKASSVQVGFRCVRSKNPRLTAEDF